MPHSNYRNGKLTQREVLKLFQTGKYSANVDEGIIYGKGGKRLIPQQSSVMGELTPYLFVNLYDNGKRVNIAVHKVIWMVATNHVVPRNFEVHHFDEDPSNNCFDNLLCCHKIDHRKFHQETNIEVPF